MQSIRSYKKFQIFYEFALPVLGLTCLFYDTFASWEIKFVLGIILLITCYRWSDTAALEQNVNMLREGIRPETENESGSWASLVGLILQMIVTIAVSCVIGLLLRHIM